MATERALDIAAEAIRDQLHERPWLYNPQGVYSGHGDMEDIVDRLNQVLDQAVRAVAEATGADDGELDLHQSEATRHLRDAQAALSAAFGQLRDAHNHVGRLCFPPRPFDG
jgi:hypothetical protein